LYVAVWNVILVHISAVRVQHKLHEVNLPAMHEHEDHREMHLENICNPVKYTLPHFVL